MTLPLLALLLLSCQAVTSLFPAPPQTPISSLLTETVQPQSLLAPTVSPSTQDASPTPYPLLPSYQSLTPFVNQAENHLDYPAYALRLHPDGDLYVGDQVSFEVIAPPGADLQEQEAIVKLSAPDAVQLGSADFESYGIAGRDQATLLWAWDTAGLEPGEHTLTYSIQPQGLVYTETVTLQPTDQLSPAVAEAGWASTTSECCTIHYITGTAAQRDLPELVGTIDEQAAQVSRLLGAEFEETVSIVLLPRVLGHGGFTSGEISVSYLDRNYAGSSPQIVLHHELVHELDGRLGGELRPTLLLEGLAVYLSGGHFKPEPLMPRAAALLDLNWYIPLRELADDFYPAQHEIGYLEAGALVAFMVEKWGWEAFSNFYRCISPAPEGGSQSEAIDAALQDHFGIGFSDLEHDFLRALSAERVTDEHRQDVRLSVMQYDTVRLYQQSLDPSAYFMTAWLPDGQQMREHGIVADYLRHPTAAENIALEALLAAADDYLREGNYPRAEEYLQAVQQALSAGLLADQELNPLAADSLALVRLFLARGYQVQRLVIDENKARVWGTESTGATAGQELVLFDLVRSQPGYPRQDSWSIIEQRSY